MKPVKVKFIQKPKTSPCHTYERKWWVLWLFNVQNPKIKLEENMIVDIVFDNGVVKRITIKKGYICDLASIPRFLWSFYTPDGVYRYIAILHDLLYQAELFDRSICDDIFKLGLTDLPKDAEIMFYKSVRLGGWLVWMKHTEKSIKEARKFAKVEGKPEE